MKAFRAVSVKHLEDDPDVSRLEERPMSAPEVRERVVAGAAVDILRGLGARAVGFVGLLVLARLLTPRDFGTVAFGATFVIFANFIADGGVGASLIRSPDPPERADLKALLAFQLVFSTVLAVVIGGALLPFGELGRVTALMVVALPLTAFRIPAVILSERQLNYRPLAAVEIVEAICYYGWAIATVSAFSWGVWGLASATVVRALVGSLVLLLWVPAGRVRPVPSWQRVRVFFGFGFRYQAVGATNVLRDQAVNAIVAVVAGVPTLGVWSVAYRILQIPFLLISSLRRVSFPGMSRLLATSEDLGETIERVIAVVAVAAGLILAPLVAATPAWVPGILGKKWNDATAVIPPASLALMIVGSLSVPLVGYLWARGEASAVLYATLAGIPPMVVVMVPLLLVIGVPAVGFGWLAGGVVEAGGLVISARKHARFSFMSRLLPPTIFGAGAAAIGWLVAADVGTNILAGLTGALVAAGTYLLALWLWHRSYLLDSVHLSVRGLRDALRASP